MMQAWTMYGSGTNARKHRDAKIHLEDEIARVVPIPALPTQRVPGLNRGAITVDDSFDEPLPDAFWLGDA